MNRMEIRMITDVMLFERIDHVSPAAFFEHARLFTDQLERRANFSFSEQFRETFGSVVVRRQEVIVRVEPEDDVHIGFLGLRPNGTEQTQKTNPDASLHDVERE